MGKQFVWKGELKFHDIVDLFPTMSDDDYAALKDHIAKHGLQTVVTTFQNKIVDGRHRSLICQELGVQIDCEEWDGDEEDLLDFVLGENLARRHLTASQKAMIGAEIAKILSDEISKESGYKQAAKQGVFTNLSKGPDDARTHMPRDAAAEAAKRVGASKAYVTQAKQIQSKSPEIAKQVKSGRMSIPEASRAIKNGDGAVVIPAKFKKLLSKFPPHARAAAWTKAVASAPDGNPTEAQVIKAMGVTVTECDDPKTLQDVIDEIEEERAVKDESDSDETWLAGLPLTGKLAPSCQRLYYEEALAWRWLSRARETWSKAVTERLNKMRNTKGPLMHRFILGLKVDPPPKWVRCPDSKNGGCGGQGFITAGMDEGTIKHACPKCHRAGYLVVS
jgi:ParB-like chromosome segregation protein Spo0J